MCDKMILREVKRRLAEESQVARILRDEQANIQKGLSKAENNTIRVDLFTDTFLSLKIYKKKTVEKNWDELINLVKFDVWFIQKLSKLLKYVSTLYITIYA